MASPSRRRRISRLFQPFARAAHHRDPEGLGLGLYIASEVARAHHGALEVFSDADETRFTFHMPMAAGVSPARGINQSSVT